MKAGIHWMMLIKETQITCTKKCKYQSLLRANRSKTDVKLRASPLSSSSSNQGNFIGDRILIFFLGLSWIYLNPTPSTVCVGILNEICQQPSLIAKQAFSCLCEHQHRFPMPHTSREAESVFWYGAQAFVCCESSPGDSDESKRRCLGSVPKQLTQNLQDSRPGRSVL